MMKIICFGDSNTYGYDPRSFIGFRYPENVRWAGRLKEMGYDVVNLGLNGREIPASETEIYNLASRIPSYGPFDFLVVMLGSNDLLVHSGFTAKDAAEKMKVFLSCLMKNIPAEKILLIAPPPMNKGEWVDEDRLLNESRCLGSCYGIAARDLGIHFADASEWNIATAYDGVHFTEEAHAEFANGIAEKLAELKENRK